MRRLLTFATLFASLLPLPSAAEEVSTQSELETAWKSGGNIELSNNITITNTGSPWTSTASSITLTGKTGAEQLSLKEPGLGQTAYAQLIAGENTEVSIKNLSLKNDDTVYLLQAASVTLNNVTISASTGTSAGAVVNVTSNVTSKLTLSGTLTLDLTAPCNTLLSCSGTLTFGTDFSGIDIKIDTGFSLGDNGVTYLMEFKDVAPTLEQLKCTVTGGSGQRVTIRTEQGSAYLCLEAPEPGSATLTLIGLIALLHRRRRRPCGRGIHGGAYVRG